MSNVLAQSPDFDHAADKEIHYFDSLYGRDSPLSKRRRSLKSALEEEGVQLRERFAHFPDSERELQEKARAYIEGPVDDNWYCGLFSSRENSWALDITPAYATLPDPAFAHMRRIAADVRILFILREPTDRIWSQIRYMHRSERQFTSRLSGTELERREVDELLALAARPGVRSRTDYVRTLDRLASHFDRDKVWIEFYDDIAREPQTVLQRICHWLGVQHVPSVDNGGDQWNRTEFTPPPPAFRESLLREYGPMVRELDRSHVSVPAEWRRLYGF